MKRAAACLWISFVACASARTTERPAAPEPPAKVERCANAPATDVGCVVGMKASGTFTCAWTEAGRFSCWGGTHGLVRSYRTDPPVAVALAGDVLCVLGSGVGKVRCFGPRYDGTEFEANGFAPRISDPERIRASGLGIVGHEICTLRNNKPHCAPLDPAGVPSRPGALSDDTKLQALCGVTRTCAAGGPGAVEPTHAPRVPGLGVVKQLSRGEQHTCALNLAGRVHCWGNNAVGQLGDGSLVDRNVPAQVEGLPLVKEIVAGTYHTCARSAAAVHCWGRNTSGELRGARIPGAASSFKRIVAGEGVCALDSDDHLRCLARVTRSAARLVEIGPVLDFAWSNDLEWCAVERSGTVSCWTNGGAPRRIDGIETARAVIPGASCAVLSDGGVGCWGKNERGQLGDGSTRASPAAQRVPGVGEVVQGSADRDLVCVRSASGRAQCWGALRSQWSLKKKPEYAGQQFWTFDPRPARPQALAGLEDVVQLDLPCARRRDGSVVLIERHCRKNKCRVEIVPLLGISDAVSVSALEGVACVVRNADGTLTARVSTLRPRDRDVQTPAPPQVGVPFAAPGVKSADVVDIVHVFQSVCARLADGRVLCGSSGEPPVEMPGLRASALVGSDAEALVCALLKDGGLRCWSENHGGEIGAGTPYDPTALFSPVPVRVLGE